MAKTLIGNKAFNRRQLLTFGGVFAVVGIVVIVVVLAAGPFATSEPENATLTGGAQKVARAGASGGQTIKFGTIATPTPAPTPTPTPAPTPPPSTGGKPSASNTGVPAGTVLTISTGDRTYSTDNQVISGLDIRGYVQITGKNVTIRNSIIRGGNRPCTTGGSQNNAPIWVREDAGASAILENIEIAPSNATACMDGIWAVNTTITRANIHGTVDGVKADDNVTIQDSYIHGLAYFAVDPNQGGGPSHNDGVQSYQCNSNIRLQRNNIVLLGDETAGAVYQVTQDGGVRCSNIVVDNNWLDGGGCTLNFAPKVLSTLTGISVTNNKFGRTRRFANCTIKAYSGTTFAAYSGNVWEDNGQPIPPPQP